MESIYTFRMEIEVQVIAEDENDARVQAINSSRNWIEWIVVNTDEKKLTMQAEDWPDLLEVEPDEKST